MTAILRVPSQKEVLVYKGKLDGKLPICVKVAHISSSNQPVGDRLQQVGDTFMILSIQGKDLPPLS